ncbi:hypothetical protein HYV81_05035 [Candidatus Woesearchaeota archaeon]|nr:hypothetical protein [Candidatus Woesearchaeota archaeon]
MGLRTAITEHDARFKCMYCSNDLAKNIWYSDFIGDSLHYKVTKCNCGRHARVKVNFLSSGHDSWMDKHLRPSNSRRLEEKVMPN